jgi:hypothetical protein
MSVRWDILGLDVVAVDDLVYVDRFPRPNTKMCIHSKRRQGSGLTATALVAAAMEAMLRRMEDLVMPARDILVDFQLVVRQSSQPPIHNTTTPRGGMHNEHASPPSSWGHDPRCRLASSLKRLTVGGA